MATANDQVARRAYEISQSEESGTDEENWLRAEREATGEDRKTAPKKARPRKTQPK